MKLPDLPGEVIDFAGRTWHRFVEIEGSLQATVLAAQAFTSLIPFMVVAAAFGPGDEDLSDRIVQRFDLDGAASRSVHALFNSSGEVESAVTWVSVAILILATASFTRAMQRMFQRAYRVPGRGPKDIWRGFAWLAGFGVWVVASGPLRDVFHDVGGILLAVIVSTTTGFFLWLGTPMILLPDLNWRRLVPGAATSAVLAAVASVVSAIYVPILMSWSAERYGLIGAAFSIQSWLVLVGFVMVIGAVLGAITNELYGEMIEERLRRRRRERTG